METLKNMNGTTSKYAKWFVRVIHPKIIDYTFTARGETINAQKFQCVLVSQDPEQYMLGLVPFAFSDREAGKKAFAKFTTKVVLEITTPACDTKARLEYNGCPVKPVVLLARPTTVKVFPPTNMEVQKYPAMGIAVSIDITELVRILKDSGSAKSLNKTFDFCGKFLDNSIPKTSRYVWGAPLRVGGHVC